MKNIFLLILFIVSILKLNAQEKPTTCSEFKTKSHLEIRKKTRAGS